LKAKLKFPTVKDADKFAIQWSRKTGGGTVVSSSGEVTVYNVDSKGKKFIEDYVEKNFGKLKLKKVNKMAVKKKKTAKRKSVGLKAGGKLKKGYKFAKGGKVVKVKTKSTAKKSSSKKSSKKKKGSPIEYAGKTSVGRYKYRLKSR